MRRFSFSSTNVIKKNQNKIQKIPGLFATFVGICHPPKPEAALRVRIGLRIKHFTKQNSWV